MSLLPIESREALSVRVGTMDDLAFIDSLQRVQTNAVGWMPSKQLEGKIAAGQVLIGEGSSGRVGYVISCDRYFKRDDCGIIYQLNVAPDRQRGLIGATLIREVFARSPYGCRLYCCWCAQNLEANYFWESLGFISLAFRTGARGKCRTHIFWQRRIREGDVTTPYWFPSETSGGSMRENRLVLPIPPGTHWKDVMPVILPGAQKQLETKTASRKRLGAPAGSKLAKRSEMQKRGPVQLMGVSFAPPPKPKSNAKPKAKKVKPEKGTHVRNDPKHVAAARELRDRYLEHFNGEQFNAGLIQPQGKYEVARALPQQNPYPDSLPEFRERQKTSKPLQLPKAA